MKKLLLIFVLLGASCSVWRFEAHRSPEIPPKYFLEKDYYKRSPIQPGDVPYLREPLCDRPTRLPDTATHTGHCD